MKIDTFINKIHLGNCLDIMKSIPDNSIDTIITDPPYGISFMNKQWDVNVPSVDIWKEGLRILKDGSFAFIMSSPRQDVLSEIIVRIRQAGFDTNFTSLYWVYASGFPKAMNIGKMIDKRLGCEREKYLKPIAYPDSNCWGVPNNNSDGSYNPSSYNTNAQNVNKGGGMREHSLPSSPEAKLLDGSYAGFQPKPALEVIIVAMKPLSEESFVDQALKNSKGITWLDNCRIPYQSKEDKEDAISERESVSKGLETYGNINSVNFDISRRSDIQGRFPANLLVSDDILNDNKYHPSGDLTGQHGTVGNCYGVYNKERPLYLKGNSVDSFSRYFDLDRWFTKTIKNLPPEIQKTFPFLIIPKASKSERNEGCDKLESKLKNWHNHEGRDTNNPKNFIHGKNETFMKNTHPTVKPIQLFAYLITLGSRPHDIILDPFIGSGTLGISCQLLNRKFIGIEINPEYCEIANNRLSPYLSQNKIKRASLESLRLEEV